MSKLTNIQRVIYEIKNRLQNNGDIRKLLLHDVPNALDGAAVSFDEADSFITVSPIFDMSKEPFNKNTIISVSVTRASKQEQTAMLNGLVKITILTQSEL